MSRRELLEWRVITVLLLTAQIRNRKTFEKYLEMANVRFIFHSFRTTQITSVTWECQNEGGVWDDGLQLWIVACRLNSLKCTETLKYFFHLSAFRTGAKIYLSKKIYIYFGFRHTGTCSVHFQGDPRRSKFHPVSPIFALPQYLKRKPPKSRRVKATQGSQGNTTQTSKNKEVFTSTKQTRRYTGTTV